LHVAAITAVLNNVAITEGFQLTADDHVQPHGMKIQIISTLYGCRYR